MSRITDRREKIFHTDLGTMNVVTEQRTEFDVDDVIQLRALSQARMVQLINLGKSIDINAPTGPRTIKSTYLENDEELPD